MNSRMSNKEPQNHEVQTPDPNFVILRLVDCVDENRESSVPEERGPKDW